MSIVRCGKCTQMTAHVAIKAALQLNWSSVVDIAQDAGGRHVQLSEKQISLAENHFNSMTRIPPSALDMQLVASSAELAVVMPPLGSV